MQQSQSKAICAGFSLIEVMLVLGLFTFVVTLAIMNFSFIERIMVRSELDKLYATCMYLQQCAQVSNEEQTLTFLDEKNGYSFNGHRVSLPAQVRLDIMPGVQGPPAAPQSILHTAITFKKNCIAFNPNGIIQAGTIYLTDSKKSCMFALSSSIAQVAHLRRYYYDGTWHLLS